MTVSRYVIIWKQNIYSIIAITLNMLNQIYLVNLYSNLLAADEVELRS